MAKKHHSFINCRQALTTPQPFPLILALALAACSEKDPSEPNGAGGAGLGGAPAQGEAGHGPSGAAGESRWDDIPACTGSFSVSDVEATFGLSCMPANFEGRVRLTTLQMRSSEVVANATFVPDEIPDDPNCSAMSSLGYSGALLPGLEVGRSYSLELQHNADSRRQTNAAIALRDDDGRLLVGWFWQDIQLLSDVGFVSEFGLDLSAEPACQVADGCVTALAYNRLNVSHGEDMVQLEIGDEYAFDELGSSYLLGLNGGSHRRGPRTPGCADGTLGNDVVFAVVLR